METTENKRNIPLFVLKIVLNVIFYAVIIMLLLFSIMNINAGSANGGFPNIFGKGILSVQSDSMTRSTTVDLSQYGYDDYEIGTFASGDLLLVDVMDEKECQTLKVGDVITYTDEINGEIALNTHRIVYIHKDDNGNIDNVVTQGDLWASTKGVYDITNPKNWMSDDQIETIADFSRIKGRVTKVISGGGKVLDNLQDNWLFYFIVPVLVFLLIEIFLVVKNIVDLKNSKNKLSTEEEKEKMRLEIEADERERIRQEVLAELKAKEGKNDGTNQEPDSNVVVEKPTNQRDESATTNEEKPSEPVIEESIEDEKPVDEVTEVESTLVEESSNQEDETTNTNEEVIETPNNLNDENSSVEETSEVSTEESVEDEKPIDEVTEVESTPVEESSNQEDKTTNIEDVKEESNENVEEDKVVDTTSSEDTVVEEEPKDDSTNNVDTVAEEVEETSATEVKETKKTAPKKTTTTKKSTGTTKKTSTTGTKKSSASTTKKTSTSSTAKKTGTTTKKTTSSTAAKKTSTTGAKKTTTTKKEDTSKSKKEKSE